MQGVLQVVPLPQGFPPGQYTLSFIGVTRAGVRQEVRATRAMVLSADTKQALSAGSTKYYDLRQFEPRFLRLGDPL
jgi:hypothetical protein